MFYDAGRHRSVERRSRNWEILPLEQAVTHIQMAIQNCFDTLSKHLDHLPTWNTRVVVEDQT